MKRSSFTDPLARSLPLPTGLLLVLTMFSPAGQADAETLVLRISDTETRNVQVGSASGMFITSPAEGLWSVATNWTDGWPSDWVHASPEQVERTGDWTIVSGKITLAGGVMHVRDAYRLEQGLLRGTRRWTWTGTESLPRATLSVRWMAPGAVNAQPMMPGVVIYGNPAGEKTGNHAVAVHAGKPGDKTFFEEHRFSRAVDEHRVAGRRERSRRGPALASVASLWREPERSVVDTRPDFRHRLHGTGFALGPDRGEPPQQRDQGPARGVPGLPGYLAESPPRRGGGKDVLPRSRAGDRAGQRIPSAAAHRNAPASARQHRGSARLRRNDPREVSLRPVALA